MKKQRFIFSKSIAALCIAIGLLATSCQEFQTDPTAQLSDELGVNEGNNLVPGMYIVTLHDNSKELDGLSFRKSGRYEDMQSGMRKVAVDVARKHKVSSENIKTVFGSALKGFTVFLSESELKEIRKDPSVKSIVQDRYIVGTNSMRKTSPGKPGGGTDPDPEPDPDPVISAPWNLDRIDQRNLPLDGKYSPPNRADNVTAYIVGSAINTNHVEFEGRASNVDLTEGGIGFLSPNPLGTEIAGVVGGKTVGIAKGINLVGVVSFTQNFYGSDQEGLLSEFLNGLDWIHSNATLPSVVYLRTSGPTEGLPVEFINLINTTLDALSEKGLALFAASGSSGVDACTWLFPNHPNVFTTGMSDKYDYRVGGNYGACIDLFAPGFEILTADGLTNDGYRFGNAIVVTAAQTMGVAAMYLQENPNASPEQVYEFLRSTSTKNVVKLAKSANNHLLFSGLNDIGAGEIDPSLNYDFELTASSNKVNGSTWRVYFSWTPIEGDLLNLYVDGVGFASLNNSGFLSLEVKGKNIAPKTYKLCVPGTTNCSNTVTVNF